MATFARNCRSEPARRARAGGGLEWKRRRQESWLTVRRSSMARVAAALRERGEAKSRCLAALGQYSEAFYRELTRLLGTLREQGIDVGPEQTRAPLSDGLETFTFEWEG